MLWNSGKSVAYGPDRRLRPIVDADLAEDVLDVLLDGLIADVEHLGDLLVRQSLGHLPQHVALTFGQRGFHVGGQPVSGQGPGRASETRGG